MPEPGELEPQQEKPEDASVDSSSAASPGEGPAAGMDDAALRSVIQQAAARGPRPPARSAAGLASRAASDESGTGDGPRMPARRSASRRLTMTDALALRRLPVDRTSRPQMILAAMAYLAMWGISIWAGIQFRHFETASAEPAQFLTLLASSLVTFGCAVVAIIELLRFHQAGRSVTIGLALINAVLVAVLAFYGRHWLFAGAQFAFAIGIIGLLIGTSRTSTAHASGAGASDADPPAEPAKPRRTPATIGLALGGGLLVLTAFGALLYPTMTYGSLRQTIATDYASLDTVLLQRRIDAIPAEHPDVKPPSARPRLAGTDRPTAEVTAQAEGLVGVYCELLLWSELVGETPPRVARWRAQLALCLATIGDAADANAEIYAAIRLAPSEEVYRLHAQVLATIWGVSYVPQPVPESLARTLPREYAERFRHTLLPVEELGPSDSGAFPWDR